MESLSNLLKIEKKGKIPPHVQSAKVDEILKVVKETKKYSYKYWLRKVKNFSYGDVLSICKDASNLPYKYNKGGFITNKLCKKISNNSQKKLNLSK